MPRKKHKLGSGNIAAEAAYDPFPKKGLVKQHEQFIRDNVHYFCRQNPGLKRERVLFRAVEIALAAEKAFKPELGSFATYLIWRLRELKRLHNEADKGVPIEYASGELERDQAEERGEDVELDFSGGGNGPQLTFDLQWCLATVFQTFIDESEIRTYWSMHNGNVERCTNYSRPHEIPILEFLAGKTPRPWARHRVAAGVQLGGADNALAIHKRISADLPEVVRQQPIGEILKGWLKAVVDHLIRRQREADDEAQKRLVGDYSPTFLEAERNAVDVRFPGAKRPPKYLPKHMPLASLDEPLGKDEYEGDGGKRTLHDVVSLDSKSELVMGDTLDKQVGTLKWALQEVRPTLPTSELPVADRMMDILEGRRSYSQADLAADMRRSPGYVSKLWHSVAGKVANKIGDRKLFSGNRKLSGFPLQYITEGGRPF